MTAPRRLRKGARGSWRTLAGHLLRRLPSKAEKLRRFHINMPSTASARPRIRSSPRLLDEQRRSPRWPAAGREIQFLHLADDRIREVQELRKQVDLELVGQPRRRVVRGLTSAMRSKSPSTCTTPRPWQIAVSAMRRSGIGVRCHMP